MTRDELLATLQRIGARQHDPSLRVDGGDEEDDHLEADDALLAFIDDPEITEAFAALTRWYS